MNLLNKCFLRIVTYICVLILASNLQINQTLAQQQNKNINPPSRLTWLNRPWDVRFILFAMNYSTWNALKKEAIKENNNPKNKHNKFPMWAEFFEPSKTILRWGSQTKQNADSNWVTVPVFFDRDGWVISPHTHVGRLRGRIDENLNFVLTEENTSEGKIYILGFWFMGINEYIPMGITPGFCEYQDMEPLVDGNRNSTTYRYGSQYTSTDLYLFGCREWAYQLRAPFRPYIDVSSYSQNNLNFDLNIKNKKNSNKSNKNEIDNSPQTESTVINFIGWSDFEHRKPVIGQHFGKWYCFFECPNGEAPGPIDIESWTKRNGWRVPIPPTRMPVFPDDPNLQGDYPDAYNPLSD